MANTVLVTGASSGIGRGIALKFGQEGWEVTLVARRKENLEKVENKSKNFVFNRGAGGLRQITKVKKISETQLLKNCYKRVA